MIEFGMARSGTLEPIIRARDEGPSSTTAAALESQLQGERAERRCERFFWALAVLALVTVLITALAPWQSSVLCLLFSLVIAIGLGKWLEVPFVVAHLERWYDRASVTTSKTEPEP